MLARRSHGLQVEHVDVALSSHLDFLGWCVLHDEIGVDWKLEEVMR